MPTITRREAIALGSSFAGAAIVGIGSAPAAEPAAAWATPLPEGWTESYRRCRDR